MITGLDVQFVVRDLPLKNEAGKEFYADDEDDNHKLLYATDTLEISGINWKDSGEIDHLTVRIGETVTTLFPRYFDGDIVVEMA